MNRKLRSLNQILTYQLEQQGMLVQVDRKGPILNIMLERLPVSAIDEEELKTTVRSAIDASAVTDIRKVNLYTWTTQQESDEPEWSTSFSYEPLTHALSKRKSLMELRRNYPEVQILFFSLAITLGSWYAINNQPWYYLVPPISALSLGILFPWIKRLVKPYTEPLKWGGVGLGLLLLGIGAFLVWQRQFEGSIVYTPFLILGFFLIALVS